MGFTGFLRGILLAKGTPVVEKQREKRWIKEAKGFGEFGDQPTSAAQNAADIP